jgi:CO dehydrogenase maturation factor
MKVAFLGKGGSGKSTMATALVNHLRARTRVLAVDADHNMDLSYNLGIEPCVFLGSDPDAIKEFVGAPHNGTFVDALRIAERNGVFFSLSPDLFTQSVTTHVDENLILMTAGPHTPRVRAGDACSHSLAGPLKVYLPRLALKPGEWVVIDERAGTDPVATGILKGIDIALIVREPTLNSSRVAEQIARELSLAGVPYRIVENKINGIERDVARMRSALSLLA